MPLLPAGISKRWIAIVLLATPPLVLLAVYLRLIEQRSWLPRTLKHDGSVTQAMFSPDGKTIAVAVDEKGVALWDAKQEELTRPLPTTYATTHSLCFSPAGELIASGGSGSVEEGPAELRMWDCQTGQLTRKLYPQGNHLFSIVFTPDGNTIITSSGRGGAIEFWDVQTGKLRRTLKWDRDLILPTLALSADGKALASGVEGTGIRIWEMKTGKLKQTWTLPGDGDFPALAFAPRVISGHKDMLATGNGDGIVRLWNPHTGRLLRKLYGHTDQVQSLAFSADGSLFVSGGYDGFVRIWSTAKWELLRTMKEGKDTVTSVAFSPDGTTLAVGGRDGKIILWRIK